MHIRATRLRISSGHAVCSIAASCTVQPTASVGPDRLLHQTNVRLDRKQSPSPHVLAYGPSSAMHGWNLPLLRAARRGKLPRDRSSSPSSCSSAGTNHARDAHPQSPHLRSLLRHSAAHQSIAVQVPHTRLPPSRSIVHSTAFPASFHLVPPQLVSSRSLTVSTLEFLKNSIENLLKPPSFFKK
ncbi:hypothetical protein BDY17DRAFT_36485 [Neohortaea acidophila]|uniref:Uncharacterized protein n=1 Tax=Neohortaea acidophila TaxID=245834 RepID=A0A6A6PM63_9PEZI|nr:uncharacterized protein BDY17DRAFT_36485 [Neohortaea acidophila]KAF2480347.1 hypothetical protein BDY17DRAFT_36485 [Neohortaea acidophila]